jgi:hypothetical protein
MPLNKQKGHMYPWVTHTLTCLAGVCPHQCSYCYVNDLRRYPQLAEKYSGEPRLVQSDMRLNLGSGKVIFVVSTHDLFAAAIQKRVIWQVLELLMEYPDNLYLFQTKNPSRYKDFDFDNLDAILGTTIESNRCYGPEISLAPDPLDRAIAMTQIVGRKMVAVEPILDFDLTVLVEWLEYIKPDFVSIGADSKGHDLPEPHGDKVNALIEALQQFTEVKQKSNLQRLLT